MRFLPFARRRLFAILLLNAALFSGLKAQFLQNGFGKNRVQYHRQMREWQYYETRHLTTYWYGDGRSVAHAALQIAEADFDHIQQLLEHQLADPIELLIFTDITDLKQSNIGTEDLFLLKSGETKVMGNKVFVYFNGDHNHLRKQLREGMAHVMVNAMLFGSNLQEIVQNAVLLNLPDWYVDGLAAYCGESWSVNHDDQLRQLLATGKYANFDKLVKHHPKLAGHAFWYYIARHFGESNVSNLLYLTRINRGLDAGFRYVLGNGYEYTTAATLDFFKKRYADDARIADAQVEGREIKFRNKRQLPISQVKVSPDGKRIVWVTNDIGRWKVWQFETQSGKRKLLMKGGTRNALQATDYNYPLLAWSPDNQRLAVIYEQRDVVKLAMIDRKTHKKEIKPVSPEFQRVFSADFVNPVDLVFSAAVRGYCDLYIYHTVNRQTERLTQDMWDDLDANFVRMGEKRYIFFASNRPTDTLSQQRLDSLLPIGTFDLFLYDLDTRSPELIRVTQTPLADERQPVMVDSAHFAYLGDQNGIRNRYNGFLEDYIAYNKATVFLKNGSEASALDTKHPGEWPFEKILAVLAPLDTVLRYVDSAAVDSIRFAPVYKKRAVAWPSTNYPVQIETHDAALSYSAELTGKAKQARIRYAKTEVGRRRAENPPTRYRASTRLDAGMPEEETIYTPPPPKQDTVVVIEPGWLFHVPEHLRTHAPAEKNNDEEKPKESPTPVVTVVKPLTHKTEIVRFNPSKIVPYRLKFRTDYITTTMDNNLLFEGLDSYAGSPAGFKTPSPGLLVKSNFKELLEDYVIEAGFRLPVSFNGAEYYLWLDDKKRRMDRRYAIYRKNVVNTVDPPSVPGGSGLPYQVRTVSLLGQYELRYPLSPFFSLRSLATIRQDKAVTLTTDRVSLERPDVAEQRLALRLSAVFDNTLDVDYNIKNGTRARVFVEAVKRFEFNTQPNWSLKFNSGFMTVLGVDARHYQRLDRFSIFAVRGAGGTTLGSERILYYLGGIDNWLLPQFDNSLAVSSDLNFAYQTLAANMRGFRQNVRNGNSYALLNNELRIPVLRYFYRKPTPGNFVRNFQIVAFFDAGTAWIGKNPYSLNNPLNIVYFYAGPNENPATPEPECEPCIVTLKVNYFRNPVVMGYGLGVRVPLFGLYFRADYAWGIETNVLQKPILYFGLGTDF